MPRDPQYPRTTVMLSPSHRAILEMLAAGYTTEEISVERGVALQTVKNQLVTIYGLLGASTRAHAIAIAVQRGIIRVDDHG